MLRLAYLRVSLVAAVGLVAAAPRPAAASSALSFYTVPTTVDLLPSADAATRVVIHGAFFQLTSDMSMTYTAPKCGVMYFQCVAGQEAMCRMQWKELRDWNHRGLGPSCAGFGSLNVVSGSMIRGEGAALGAPDAWDLGMGIGEGIFVDNKCPAALALVCPVGPTDAGTTTDAAPAIDATASSDVAPPSDAVPSIDLAASTDVATTPPAPDAGAVPPPKPDAAVGSDANKPQLASKDGCALAGGSPARASGPLAALALLAFAGARARRRRR